MRQHVEIAPSLDEHGKPEIIPRAEDELSPEEYEEVMEGAAPEPLTEAQVNDYENLIKSMRNRHVK